MTAWLVAARTVHFASAMLLFGELVFALVVLGPAWRAARHSLHGGNEDIVRGLFRLAGWSLAASVASGALWLAVEAASMSGLPLPRALDRDTLALVLGSTTFGRLWVLRSGLAIALGALLVAIARPVGDKPSLRLPLLSTVAVAVAAAYVATLAWAGHAGAGLGSLGYAQLVSDVAHLLAAGAWVGALPGLVLFLGSAPSLNAAAQAARRFSTLGAASVGTLVLSGIGNACFLVGSVPALLGTSYGRLLLVKLAVFTAMLTLAAVNRLSLTPRLAGGEAQALRSLRRNAGAEIAAGIIVVAVVGVLGITIPGAHQSALWPFDYTLSWQAARESVGVALSLTVAGVIAGLSAGAVFSGVRRHRSRQWVVGIVGMAVAGATWIWLLAAPAYPTTYVASPVRYTTDSLVRGASLYSHNCSICHGARGHGDGPAAASLSVKPANLAEHASHHRAGDLFWWIAHGLPQTPMPGFAPPLSDTEIWELIQYLRAQSAAELATAMGSRVEPWRPIVAPGFTFERSGVAGSAQQALQQRRGDATTLLVFFTLPQSLPRLRALAAAEPALAAARARVIALSRDQSPPPVDAATETARASLFAVTDPSVAVAYAMFAPPIADAGDHAHVEFLIDRQGYLRARWIGLPASAADRTAEQLSQIELLNAEPARAPPAEEHVH